MFVIDPRRESYSKEDIDYWIDVVEEIILEAYENPEIVKTAPHRQTIGKIHAGLLEESEHWAMTWRAYVRKRS